MKTKLPVIFVTHGSPMLAIEPGQTGPLLTQLGQSLPISEIKAILVISAHWISRFHPVVTSSTTLETIHDFGGFPKQLYHLQYPAKGEPKIAALIKQTLKDRNIEVEMDSERGLDHGAWIPLQYIRPEADIPVVQLSMPWPMDPKQAINFGEALKPLREQGILIMASGSMTHNLYDVDYEKQPDVLYIKPFVEWVRKTIQDRDLEAMQNYRELAPYAKQAHPTEEHFLPLIIALAASDKTDPVIELNGGVTYRALAMDNYVFG